MSFKDTSSTYILNRLDNLSMDEVFKDILELDVMDKEIRSMEDS